MKEFSCKTKIFSGSGAIAALSSLGAKRLMVVSDPFFVKSGTAAAVAQAAKADAWEIFGDVQPDPSVELVARGAAAVKAFAPDMLVALGGGSAIDCAKAMAFWGGCSRLVAIPTTSGSGSEVTDFAILTHDGVKHPLVDNSLRPEVAILDDDLLTQLPPGLVAGGGFDVLTHSLEAFVATNASAFTDALAADAFCTVFDLLEDSFDGCLQARSQIHAAATAAGLAFTHAGLGICHALAHSLGGAFHLPHGPLNAILLPSVIRCNSSIVPEKYALLAQRAGVGSSAKAMAVRNLTTSLIRLRKAIKLPGTLAEAGICPAEIMKNGDALICAALQDPCCATNPIPPTRQMLEQILYEVTGRG